ncbi:acyl-ACP--UDP-N-acetylglucosamine O-acyltransferase [Segetibacter koreensis]|uniref:acyl-ACP--UDP-N-acetylglucosamine O-acyltransferase n=1 Tax=Segetibacter koreensis TaxID=398037 RepID=UPI0003701AE9|nr:acyl-ACP--UDP-N-acetylglucosamine O-acyltransferase [Segetibacter koreensis]
MSISPLAYIHKDAKIGENVTIEPFAVIQGEVSVGDGSHIMSHAVIMDGSNIGKNCVIYPGAVIGAIPQDLKFIGEKTTVEIGDGTTIRECATVNRGTKDKWKTVVGQNCLIMGYAHIAHDCILGNNVILANAVQLAGHVEIGNYAIMSGLSGAVQFTRIGAHTYVAGHTVVRKDVPPYVKAAREPMSFAGINTVGLQRSKFSPAKIQEITDIYKILFIEKNTTTAALEKVEATFPPTPERDAILNFIKSSKTGIIKRPSKTESDEDKPF